MSRACNFCNCDIAEHKTEHDYNCAAYAIEDQFCTCLFGPVIGGCTSCDCEEFRFF